MLQHTFLHLPHVSSRKEKDLWQRGIFTWDDYSKTTCRQLSLFEEFPRKDALAESRKALNAEDLAFFARSIHPHEYYRLAASFPEDVMFLDIETTGLSFFYHDITLIGWSIGNQYAAYIAGGDTKNFNEECCRAKLLVTFNGTLFDIKFIKKFFPAICLPPYHIDLRFFARRVGLTGGQKHIEKEIGFTRQEDLQEMQGDSAPILWYKYQRGDLNALKKLILYNKADIEGMKYILDFCINAYCKKEKIPQKICPPKKLFQKQKMSIHFGKTAKQGCIKLEPYSSQVGPKITYTQLADNISLDSLCVAGIDLVASEQKASGFCILHGAQAETARCTTDAEMIERICAANVRLVSIDSPLSLPAGRTSCWDSDPFRQQFGITRYCERELHRRGISSYPCLIQSMQKLTSRGMELAKKLRKLGIPVIESYPGAAQDIMGIPKKQAGQKYLALGLQEFGIYGNFCTHDVSHDELDAITSAIVGYFFWAGKFEALGTEEEAPLIIPDLTADNEAWLRRRVIGISGLIGSGKTTAAQYLASRGYTRARFSDILRQQLLAQNIEPTRSTLQRLGLEVYSSDGGQRALGRKVAQRVENTDRAVIDGLRFPEDRATLIEFFGPAFTHIHLNCKQAVLIKHQLELHEDISPAEALRHDVERGISPLAKLADVHIPNDGTKAELFAKLEKFTGEEKCQ